MARPAEVEKLVQKGEACIILLHPPGPDIGRRTPLVARVSKDEGQTWSDPLSIEDDLTKTYSYISARVAGERVLLSYYVESSGRYSLKFKSIPIDHFDRPK